MKGVFFAVVASVVLFGCQTAENSRPNTNNEALALLNSRISENNTIFPCGFFEKGFGEYASFGGFGPLNLPEVEPTHANNWRIMAVPGSVRFGIYTPANVEFDKIKNDPRLLLAMIK